jgi:hypothetical protein
MDVEKAAPEGGWPSLFHLTPGASPTATSPPAPLHRRGGGKGAYIKAAPIKTAPIKNLII